jgi:poly-gamma-glutamate capsule biosynthesis protein CapA/YwtB (metallophosphatase superfamily)
MAPEQVDLPVTTRGHFRIAVGGDMIGPNRPVSPLQDPELDEVLNLFRSAAVGCANHEGSTFDLEQFGGYRAAENGGGYPLTSPAAARDLPAIGINMVALANNHAADWGAEGLLATIDTLDGAGVAHAGTGANRAAAQRPGYLETAHGRIAIVSCTSTFAGHGRAGDAGAAFVGRPGLFAYRVQALTQLPAGEFETIRTIAARQSGSNSWLDSRAFEQHGRVVLGDEIFEQADDPGLRYEVNARDHQDLLNAVRYAKQTADLVIVSVHCHQTSTGSGDDPQPPQFLVDLFRAAIAEGADIGLTTGPHNLRGVEIYRGKPVFHGLGSLFLEMESGHGPDPDILRDATEKHRDLTAAESIHAALALPDSWYDGLVSSIEFEGSDLVAVHLHPLRLTHHDGVRLQGSPRLARDEVAQSILSRFADISSQLGTRVDIHGDYATVRLPKQS